MKATEKPVQVTVDFKQSRTRLWEALTNHSEMIQWFFENIPEFKAQKGFKTRFTVHTENRSFEHNWHISEVTPFEKIVYDWSYNEYPGRAQVVFQLSGDSNSSRLTLTNTVIEDFPEDIPEFERRSCLNGWNYFIEQRLSAYLK